MKQHHITITTLVGKKNTISLTLNYINWASHPVGITKIRVLKLY